MNNLIENYRFTCGFGYSTEQLYLAVSNLIHYHSIKTSNFYENAFEMPLIFYPYCLSKRDIGKQIEVVFFLVNLSQLWADFPDFKLKNLEIINGMTKLCIYYLWCRAQFLQ